MKKNSIILLMFAMLLTCCGGNSERHKQLQEWMTPNGKIKVLSTTAMIDDIVKHIGGNYIDSTVLIKGQLDPHSYQLVKGDAEKFSFADIIIANGLGLEHGPSVHAQLSGHKKTLSLGDEIKKSQPLLILQYNGQLDPHIWMDISLWQKTIPFIVDRLSQLKPEHAQYFQENGENLDNQLSIAHEEIKSILHDIPEKKRYLVTSHDAFNYFTRAYLAEDEERKDNTWQKRFAAPEGLAPDSQLSASDIKAIIEHLKKYDITILFTESNLSKDSIKKIADAALKMNLKVKIASPNLYGDAMGEPGSDGDTYIKMLLHNAKTIAAHLESV